MKLTLPKPLVEDRVVELVEHLDRRISRRTLHAWGEAGATLLRWGALESSETLTSIVCDGCEDHHIVELECDPDGGTWRYYCGSVGFVAVDADDLATYALDWDWLVSRLAELLSIRRLEMTSLIDGVMWRLGTARLDTGFWTAVLVRDVERNLNGILEQLKLVGRVHPGLLFSSSPATVPQVGLPNDYRWLRLRDLLNAESGELVVSQTAIMAALRVRRRDGPPGKAGRPSETATILAELHRRAGAGELLETVSAEARHLVEWLNRSARSCQRSPGTIENIIRTTFKNLKQDLPRPTK